MSIRLLLLLVEEESRTIVAAVGGVVKCTPAVLLALVVNRLL